MALTQEELKKIAEESRKKHEAKRSEYAKTAKVIHNELQKNHNVIDAVSHGAKTGANNLEHSFNSAWLGLQHTGADLFGMDDAANSLAEKLRQNAQAQAQRQAEINAQYDTNFGMLAKGLSDVTSGAIGMLPTIGAAILTPQGKVAAAGKLAQFGGKALRALPSTGVLGVQTAGSGINQALNEGAGINEAKKYGLGSAVKEVATELPFAGIAKVPGLVKINNGIGKLVTEGAEEALAEALDPYLQRATYNPNAENASWDDMLYSALIGGGTAGLINSGFAGAGKAVNMALGTGKNKKTLPTAPKNMQNQGMPVQTAQNGAGQVQDASASKYLPRPDKAAQNQFIEVEKIRKQMLAEQNSILKQKRALEQQKAQLEQAEREKLEWEIKNLEDNIGLLRGTQSSAFDDALFNAMDGYTAPEQKQETVSHDMPMSERTLDNVSNPKVKAYQSTHPEVKAFFREQAEIMLNDLNNMIDGGREYGFDPETRNVTTVRSQTRATSSQIERLLNAGMTKAQIRDGLERIIRDNGAENTANAKKVETTLDDALANGSKNLDYVYGKADIKKMQNAYNQLNSDESFANSADPAGLINELEYLNENITERQQLIDAYSELLPDMSVYETMTAEELHNEMDKLENASQYAPDEIAGEMMARHKYLETLEEGRVNEFIENENIAQQIANMEMQLKKLRPNTPLANVEVQNIQKKLQELEAKQAGISIFNKDVTVQESQTVEPEPTIAENETVAEESSTVEYEDFDVSKLKPEVRDFYNMVNEAGKRYGFNIRVVTGIENDANGMFDGQGNILIDGNKMTDEKTISKVIGHEAYHCLKSTQEHKYIADLAISYLHEKTGLSKEQLMQRKYDAYANGGVILDSKDAILDEIGAEFMQEILSDPAVAERIWAESPTLAERIIQFFKDMINRLQGKANTSDVTRKALDAYSRGLRNMQYQNQNAESDGDRYSLPKKLPNSKYIDQSDENLRNFMEGSAVVNEDGSPKVVYSGHGNTNLFGTSFDKKKATAGGFYFTANPEIASNYAKDKLGVKEYYENGDEYRIKNEKGQYKLKLRDIRLTDEQVEKFDEWFDEDLGWTYEDFVKERGSYDSRYRNLRYSGGKHSLSNVYWLMNELGYTETYTYHRKNGEEYRASAFETLMDEMGIEWDSYNQKSGGVFPIYLSIKNPIDTSQPFPQDVMKRLERIASRERRMSWEELDDAHWTGNYPVYKWIEDIKRMEETGEETYWATQVPTKARKILQEMGYDGIKDTGGKMGGEEHEVWIAFEPTQVKSAIGNRGTYDATKKDMRYSLNDMVDKYGALPKGEDPYGTNRDIDVPRQTADDNRVSKWAGTAMEAEQVEDVTVGMIERDMEQGRFTYEPTGNQEQINRADGLIHHTGWQKQVENFRNKYSSGQRMTADDIVLGERLIQEAQSAGEYETAVDLIADIAAIGTELGQAVQALSVLKRLTPEGKVKALKRVEERINAGLVEQGQNPVKLPEGMAEQMLQAESQQMQSEIWDECVQELANQVPATLADKINAWRYLAMLSNPKTHIRNMVGNGVMSGVSAVKRGIQVQLENRLLTAGEERYAELNRNVPQEYFDFARWSWDNEGKQRAKAGGGRYNDAISQIEQNRRIFDNDKLETARKTNTELLEAEDMWFKERIYINALARYMHTNGLSPNALQSMASNASYSKGVDFALKEAYKGTFQEASKVANLLAQMEHSSPAAKLLMGGVMPFKKTPINILKRGVEYSPVGLMNGIYKLRHDVQTGKCTPAEAIDSIAAGLTGTGIMIVGYFMASMGWITAGAGEDDERKQWYDQSMGSQNYALVLPNGGTATIDWLAPSVMPLMAGAELYSQMVSENPANENSSAVTSTLEAISKVANPMLEMSMLQGVTDALQSYNSGTSGVLSDLITSTATSYGGQFIPAPVGAAARTIDDTVRSSYAPKDSAFTKTGEKFVRQQMNKLPFASMLNEASVDVWGNEVERAGGNIVGRAFNNFLNPATYSSDKRTELDKKLDELYKATGNSGVLPKSGTTYINESDSNPKVYLSAKEYAKYGTTRGQNSYQYVNAFVNSAAYSQLSDDDKAEIISELYDLANYQAKKEALNGRGYNYTKDQYEKVLKSKMAAPNYYIVKYNMDLIADNVTTGQKREQIAHLQGLKNAGQITDEQFWYLRRAQIGKFSKAEMAACPYAWIKQL